MAIILQIRRIYESFSKTVTRYMAFLSSTATYRSGIWFNKHIKYGHAFLHFLILTLLEYYI